MIGRIHFIYRNGVRRKEFILLVFLGLINIANAFALVNTADSYLLVPRNSSINVTCTFTDDQGAGADAVSVSWSRENGNQDIKEGVDTNWNETSQSGETRLLISNITDDEQKYICLVSVNGSVDYKRIKVQSINNTHEKTLDNKVEVTPYMEEVKICNGPPLKLNCSFKFRDRCTQEVRVGWWEYNNDTQVWGKHVDGISWVSNGWNGTGWLNISNPGTETTFMCVVTCGDVGNVGIRVMVPVPPQPRDGQKIKARHAQYPAVRNMSLMLVCDIDKNSYSESGWWFNGSNIGNSNKHTLDNKKNSIELLVQAAGGEDEGQYTCWVSKDDWWDAASATVYISGDSYT
ncbi:SWPV2-ORF155 [Shearwaterpox virus]|uniref:SWPV2-ORF155 n=1 Tax=Shearwaterpox virus TaxID=1974596 RepID=A0A1V0QGB4_CNPV|nr:SWPV2-ORF155 [Shearwaterpox virus]